MHTALLDLTHLPIAARQAHLLPDLKNRPLVSIRKLYDHNCTAQYEKHQFRIFNQQNKIYLCGPRDPTTGLWKIKLDPPTHSAKSVYKYKKQVSIFCYLHQACGIPVMSTWINSINAHYFATWTGLTASLVKKHLTKALATAKGHLKQCFQVLQSTQTKNKIQPDSIPSTTPIMKTDSPSVQTN